MHVCTFAIDLLSYEAKCANFQMSVHPVLKVGAACLKLKNGSMQSYAYRAVATAVCQTAVF